MSKCNQRFCSQDSRDSATKARAPSCFANTWVVLLLFFMCVCSWFFSLPSAPKLVFNSKIVRMLTFLFDKCRKARWRTCFLLVLGPWVDVAHVIRQRDCDINAFCCMKCVHFWYACLLVGGEQSAAAKVDERHWEDGAVDANRCVESQSRWRIVEQLCYFMLCCGRTSVGKQRRQWTQKENPEAQCFVQTHFKGDDFWLVQS